MISEIDFRNHDEPTRTDWCVAQEPAAPEGKLKHPSPFSRRQLLSMKMQTIINTKPCCYEDRSRIRQEKNSLNRNTQRLSQ